MADNLLVNPFVAIAHQLNNAVTRSRKKTFKVFIIADGGSEHCHGDNRIVGAIYVADWVAETLIHGT